jgi:hypothetical protein
VVVVKGRKEENKIRVVWWSESKKFVCDGGIEKREECDQLHWLLLQGEGALVCEWPNPR